MSGQYTRILRPAFRIGRYACLSILALVLLGINVSCSDDPAGPEGGDSDEYSYCDLQPLPDPTGTVMTVGDTGELISAVSVANLSGSATILLEDGIYEVPDVLYFTADDITVRSISGNRDNVTIRADGMGGTVSALIMFRGNGFTAADMTLGWVNGNAIVALHDADDCLMHNLRIVDTDEQMIKVAQSGGATTLTERGEVRWCLFEYTAGEGPQEYIGGVYALEADGWSIHHNIFRNIKGPGTDIAGPAIFFWSECANTVIEHNTIYCCDRGIMLGLGSGEVSHTGGMVRNNMVHTDKDVGISLESAVSVSIYNNTVFTESYINSIEYRFAGTQYASIINNLTNGLITSRNGGTGVLETNVTGAQASWFIDVPGGDLRLGSSQAPVVDQGTTLMAVPIDIDCEERPRGDATDIGADEY